MITGSISFWKTVIALTMISILGTRLVRSFRFPGELARYLATSPLVKNKSFLKKSLTEVSATSSASSSSLKSKASTRAWSNTQETGISESIFQESSGANVRSASKLYEEQLQKESLAARTPVTIVRTKAEAERCLHILNANKDAVFACDTEVIDIEIKEQGPVGNGKVICVSIYGGDAIDFGTGSTLWIENAGVAQGVLQLFKEWFENPGTRKVWHNYGFDRHVLANEGIHCKGFYGDTMHMARLWDTSRDKMSSGGGSGEGYSLASLSSSLFKEHPKSAYFVKASMIDLFGVAKLKKDGSASKKKDLPELLQLQENPETREKWIEYSARDAVATWWLHDALRTRLQRMPWIVHTHDKAVQQQQQQQQGTMFDFYQRYWRDFGELLTDMEAVGIKVDTENHLRQAEIRAREARNEMEKLFLDWASEICPETKGNINIASTTQISQLLFGHYEAFDRISSSRVFTADKTDIEIESERQALLAENRYSLLATTELKALLKERELKLTGKRDELLQRLQVFDTQPDEALRLWGNTSAKKKLLSSTAFSTSAEIDSPEAVAEAQQKGEKYYEKCKISDLQALCSDRNIVPPAAATGIKWKKRDYIVALLAHDEATRYESETLEELKGLLAARYLDWQPNLNLSATNLIGETASTDRMQTAARQEAKKLLREYDEIMRVKSTLSIEEIVALASALPGLQQEGELLDPMTLLSHLTAVEVSRRHTSSVFFDPMLSTHNNTHISSDEAATTAPSVKSSLKKQRDFTINSIGMEPVEFTSTGLPQVSAGILKKLSGKNIFAEDESETVWGTAFAFFGGGEAGKRACRAIGALAAVGQIDATINNFLVPLQALVDANQRIHCSLNLNTETGRLSSRRPNLQNQPALEKDSYKIRDAFVADKGNTLIVADYGQLELRILAHITNCQSMINAFQQGGCFHSRTAVGMYPYIQDAVNSGKVMLEWDYSKGQPTVPLVKDTYAAERRKAKTLNFSIAYGKTVHGLAADWGISKEAAEETLAAWYRDRPEVKDWQQAMQQLAMDKGYVCTMMGRYRRLPEARQQQEQPSVFGNGDKNGNINKPPVVFKNRAAMGHALRAAINTPIQGSAADVVMMAMLQLWKSPVLKSLGWKLLLQIHDEVILEGPKEHADAAMVEVRKCMENPFDGVGLSKLLGKLAFEFFVVW